MNKAQPSPAARKPSAPASKSAGVGAPSLTLSGRLRPAPLGRLGRGLVYGTGLFLLRPLLLLLHRLVGWRRESTLTWVDGAVTVESELSLLGYPLRRETERLPASRIVSAATLTSRAAEPVVLGGLAVTIALIWGLVQIADGLYGRSFGLVALGVGAIGAGVAVDLLILWVARIFPDPHRNGLAIRCMGGRLICVDAVQPETAGRFAEAVSRALTQA